MHIYELDTNYSNLLVITNIGNHKIVCAYINSEDVNFMTLDELEIGKSGVITAVNGEGALRRRLLDMGLTPRTKVMVRKVAPMGDPIEIHLRGYELTIRVDDAKDIEIERVAD